MTVYQLLSHLVLLLVVRKRPNWSTLQESFHPIEGWLLLPNLIGFLMSIVFYDVYHVIPHPPMKFQDDTLCFGWVLEVVTL